MWRHNSFLGNHNDSDQTISDEDEEQGSTFHENTVPLAATLNLKKENLGVASQLELLKGVHQVTGFSSEDEVEVPDFHNQSNLESVKNSISARLKRNDSTCELDARHLNLKEESKMICKSVVVGDNMSEKLSHLTRGKEKQVETCTSSEIDEETRGLDQLGELDSWATHQPFHLKDIVPSKGSRWKKSSRSSRVEPRKRGAFWSSVHEDKDQNSASSDELLDNFEIDYSAKEKTGHIKDSHDKTSMSRLALHTRAVLPPGDCRSSMVELLDNLQGRISKPHMKCKMAGRRKERARGNAAIRRTSSSGNNVKSDDGSAELMNCGLSSDDEDIARISRPAVVEPEGKTMADKFQEAFGRAGVQDISASFMVPKQTGPGLFGRLQQVMQRHREQDSEFMKNLQTEVWPKDEARCIDTKILSRSFDAKLTVCHCSLLENEESSIQNPQPESFGKTWTIIFNSRVCGDVDLEVGNLIRIHPPWKEVQVRRCGEITILSTYFSQI